MTDPMLYPQPRPRGVLAIFAALAAGSAVAEAIFAATRGQTAFEEYADRA